MLKNLHSGQSTSLLTLLTRAVAFFLALAAGIAQAVTVPGLYSVEVPVKSSRADDLKDGYQRGLSEVLVRITGTEEVLSLEGVEDVLGKSEDLLQTYQFLRAEGGDDQDRLKMSFGAVGVNQALAQINAPVWGANRPLTLAWVAVEENGRRNLLHAAEAVPDGASGSQQAESSGTALWNAVFRDAAERRGLPLSLPPAQYGQRRELLSDIWGQFTDSLRAASSDLSHDAIALVRVSRLGNQWRAGWVFDGLGLEGPEESIEADSPAALADAVVARWAALYADRYAVRGSNGSELPQVDMVLHGVTTLEHYAQSGAVINRLAPVEKAGAIRVAGDQLQFRLTFTGEIDQLKRYIALDPRFVPLNAPDSEQVVSAQVTAEAIETIPSDVQPAGGWETMAMSATQSASDESVFDSLYQVLHYRWQPATVIRQENEAPTPPDAGDPMSADS